ncbi:MAG: pyruvate, water dikinase regulatory protein [Hyphomicrobiaceae bacterium]
MTKSPLTYNLHLVSDSTGETLRTISKAATVQYQEVRAIEHVHPLVRTERQLQRVLGEIEQVPGIVLYTLVNRQLGAALEARCQELKIPCVPVLNPIMKVLEAYLGAPQTPTVGGQHQLDAAYFRRIDALNFTLVHDDGHLPDDLDEADIVILGISRTSKTPTSIYLANRGYKTTNLPLVKGMALPPSFSRPTKAFIVGLVASAERIAQIRRNRVLTLADRELDEYVDRDEIAKEINHARQLFQKNGWPFIDVTRRSIEETATEIMQLYEHRQRDEVAGPRGGSGGANGGGAPGHG